jgi:hypothetical protein
MKTFRGLLKSKLIELGYPVEISKFYANGRGIRGAGRDIISKEGIKIIRTTYDKKDSWRKYENIEIVLNGYIKELELQEIIKELKMNYYNKDLLSVYIWE